MEALKCQVKPYLIRSESEVIIRVLCYLRFAETEKVEMGKSWMKIFMKMTGKKNIQKNNWRKWMPGQFPRKNVPGGTERGYLEGKTFKARNEAWGFLLTFTGHNFEWNNLHIWWKILEIHENSVYFRYVQSWWVRLSSFGIFGCIHKDEQWLVFSYN